MLDLVAEATAQVEGKAYVAPKTETPARFRRLSDRLYTVTLTFTDGSIETYECSHNSLQRYRNWCRINHPTAKVTIEETQTVATSDGKRFDNLTFQSNPSLNHDPNGTFVKINEVDPKENVQRTFAWELFSDTPPSFYNDSPRMKIAEIAAKQRAEAKYNIKLTKDNGKPKEDRNLRIYLNETGALIFVGTVLDGAKYLEDNNLDATNCTLYIPEYLHSKFMSIVEDN